MRAHHPLSLTLCAAACLWTAQACTAEPLPPPLAAALRSSGLPIDSFGLYARPVDGGAEALAALNSERHFMLASTAKLVTTLSALDLLGPAHRWRSQALASAPVVNGRLAGDLVIVGGDAGLTPGQMRDWFKAMHEQGLRHVAGRIVLQHLTLLPDQDPAQAATLAEESAPGATPEARSYNRGALVVAVGPTSGAKAAVTLQPQPQPLGVVVVNDVLMGGECAAWARWRSAAESGGGPAQLWVRGRWDTRCGRQEIAYVQPPASARLVVPALVAATPSAPLLSISTPRLVAMWWSQAGGTLRRGVVETQRTARPAQAAEPPRAWASEISTPLAELVREINKTSNNVAARQLMLSLGSGRGLVPAQQRVREWLRGQGVADADLRVDTGSGQSRAEHGTPRSLVQLLQNAWRRPGAQAFVDSLPIAGVDGTLTHRMQAGSATGHAYLKTGTLHDARALAGYVRARSGKVYAVAALANHADAARATPALGAFIEWVARNG